MSRFDLLCDAKRALSRAVDLDDLVVALFATHEDLQSFRFDVTNEYDDSNYSDYSRIYSVNGWRLDYDGNYEEDEDDSEIPKASPEAINDVMNLQDYISDKHGYGEHEFERSDYSSRKPGRQGLAAMECAMALLEGRKVPASVLYEADGRWHLHHAEIHGRYGEDDEFILFAREGMMGMARRYAEKHGPLHHKTLNYFVLTLRSDDYDHEELQSYLEWLKEKNSGRHPQTC